MVDRMYEIPSQRNIEEVMMSEEGVTQKGQPLFPLLVYQKTAETLSRRFGIHGYAFSK
jgi:ATP-dependent protease Clp ATPase subunit